MSHHGKPLQALNGIEEAATSLEPMGDLRVAVTGSRGIGKSTFARLLVNRLLNRFPCVALLDADPGQPEFTPPGLLSHSSTFFVGGLVASPSRSFSTAITSSSLASPEASGNLRPSAICRLGIHSVQANETACPFSVAWFDASKTQPCTCCDQYFCLHLWSNLDNSPPNFKGPLC